MKQKRLWQAFERLASGAVMVEWLKEAGAELELAQAWLRPTHDAATTFPCTVPFGCGYPHRVEERRQGTLVAVADSDEGCAAFRLEAKDLLVYAVDTAKLRSGLVRALGLGTPSARQTLRARAELIGTYGASKARVYLMFPGDSSRMGREVERLFCEDPDPFVLLTPTGVHCAAEVESALRRQLCMHMALGEIVEGGQGGSLKANGTAGGLLGEFLKRAGEGRGLAKTVERLDRNVEAVARGQYELRKENEELKQLQADGYFKFVTRVEKEDFVAFAFIMAVGNRKAAAGRLGIPHRTFYDRVEGWLGRGKEYQRMHRLVEWRKAVGRKGKVGLGDVLQSGDSSENAENPTVIAEVVGRAMNESERDYPEILRQVLEALQAQNPKNWAAVRGELVEMLREEVG